MTPPLTSRDKIRFKEIHKSLGVIGCREGSFVRVELLFYEALTISRTYGNDPNQNSLLAALKKLEAEAYKRANEKFPKSSQRETFIKRFIVQFKNILTSA
jgi:hypothetical protein